MFKHGTPFIEKMKSIEKDSFLGEILEVLLRTYSSPPNHHQIILYTNVIPAIPVRSKNYVSFLANLVFSLTSKCQYFYSYQIKCPAKQLKCFFFVKCLTIFSSFFSMLCKMPKYFSHNNFHLFYWFCIAKVIR